MKKLIALVMVAMMAFAVIGCAAPAAPAPAAEAAPAAPAAEAEAPAAPAAEAAPVAAGKVYYLNFKPEQDEQWQAIAKAYTEETGVPVTVVTAASGQYEPTLTAEIAKSEAPTLFQVNGPVGLATWKDYCYDMSGSALYGAKDPKAFISGLRALKQ